MHSYKQLLEKLSYLESDKIEQIRQAYLVALESHFGQERDSGETYIMHPIAVATILADMRVDYQSIIAALLHDVIEDTPITKEEIAAKFGQTISDLVDGVTKLTQIESSSQSETQAQNFRKMVMAMSRDIRVILIKLADRLHNMQTIREVNPFKRQRIAKETIDIYAPIAHRLGMYQMYVDLEELSFAALYPRRYQILKKTMQQIYGKHQGIITVLNKELTDLFSRTHLENVEISGRTKHLYGIYKKMLTHRASFDNVKDVYGFRVVVANVDDCYRVLGAIHGLYKPLPGKFKDYIAIPKFNGYQSLHTVLLGPYGAPVEIQIRTQLMNQMAKNGIAVHWLYKSDDKTTNAAHMRAQQWFNNLLEMQKNTSNSLEFFEHVKVDLFPDKVYVFTPKGNIMELTRGATAIDFAYAVHTSLGNSCVAAEINRKFLPLSTGLLSGQVVSIVTSKEAEPNPEWLSFAITSKARSGIRHYLKNKKRAELIALGKQLLDRVFSELQVDFKKIRPKEIEALLRDTGFKNWDSLYENIGLGNHLATLIAYQLINNNSNNHSGTVDDGLVRPLLVHSSEVGVAINFASCCCPIPGDPIVGYFNAGHGLDIHAEDCVNLAKLRKQPEKCLPVDWADDVSGDFQVALNVEVINQQRALADLTRAIAKANAHINHMSTGERSSGYILVALHLLVKNLSHFERVKRHISDVTAVVGVIRRKGN